MRIELSEQLMTALALIKRAGGLPLLVGGAVRDAIIKRPTKDYDFEVYGLTIRQLADALSPLGQVDQVGMAFGVIKVHSIQSADFSVPRRDNKVGAGHRAFQVEVDPGMSIEDAARRRDLTINSMAYDPFEDKLHDPFDGYGDLQAHVLKATDPATFLEDPLRALRVAQFVSRFCFEVERNTRVLCSLAPLNELAGERIFEEFKKLLNGTDVDEGLKFLHETNLLTFFPELEAMVPCRQDLDWHPEGSVFVHTVMATQEARRLSDDPVVLWATLLHDAGKPLTTKFEDGRIRARGHEEAGVEPARALLGRLKAPNDLIDKVAALVSRHLTPSHFHRNKAGPSAYRRLAQFLGSAGTDIRTLELVSRADALGRTTTEALAKEFEAGDRLLQRAEELKVKLRADQADGSEKGVVMGRHLLSRGFQPGPEIGQLLSRCLEYQFESGESDPEKILNKVLEQQK